MSMIAKKRGQKGHAQSKLLAEVTDTSLLLPIECRIKIAAALEVARVLRFALSRICTVRGDVTTHLFARREIHDSDFHVIFPSFRGHPGCFLLSGWPMATEWQCPLAWQHPRPAALPASAYEFRDIAPIYLHVILARICLLNALHADPF
jgi:hypothetical protein